MISKKTGNFFVHLIAMIVAFLTLLQSLFTFGGKLFWLELLLFIVLGLTALGLVKAHLRSRKQRGLFFVYLILLINQLFLYMLFKSFNTLGLVGIVVGMLVSLKQPTKNSSHNVEPYFKESVKEIKNENKKSVKKTKTKKKTKKKKKKSKKK